MIHPKPIIDIATSSPDQGMVADIATGSEWREWLTGVQGHGTRLDTALTELVPEFSRSYLQQLILAGAVTVNDQSVVKPAYRLKASDQGRIELRPTLQSQAFKPQRVDFEVVFEDEHLRVINKPAGLVVHPAAGNWSGTLLNGLLALDPGTAQVPRAGIVHRLDKDTSGLMLVARTRKVMDILVGKIADREVGRQYLALAGKAWIREATINIDQAIGRDIRNRLRMAVVDLSHGQGHGKEAQTEVVLLGNCPMGCLLKCTLKTGRTHQIRVHLAHLGHPLVGDVTYGGQPNEWIHRQALHAFRLSFLHPLSGKQLVFMCRPPPDFMQALAGWGLSYNPEQMD